jgi:hypothetical protein
MSKPAAAIAGALSLLLLSSCGGQAPAATENAPIAAEANRLESVPPADPAQPGAPANATADPVPPPDAVSHPNGYLPPAPAEPDSPGTNSTGPDSPPPATEDQYIRNGQ